MNDDHDCLEQQIRNLRPAPLPDDLKQRLEKPPTPKQRSSGKIIVLWAAAAGAMAAACFALMANWNREADIDPVLSAAPVTVYQKDSKLLGRRLLVVKEYDGRLWEVVEEEWRDDTLAMCSATSVKFHSTEKRKRIVCAPVDFL